MRAGAARVVVVGLVFSLTVVGCARSQSTVQRGTGRLGPGLASSSLPTLGVPRTLDLVHVEPATFAAALGRDANRIFEFVRDHIAYEPYEGVLRGPRGTLLAMAGNSADRAALLGALLEQAGHRVRYVRGTLGEGEATDLVMSMWPARTQQRALASPGDLGSMVETLQTSITHNFAAIRDALRKTKLNPGGAATPVKALVREATAHYWVQLGREGQWQDLDPSFADAVPGQTYAGNQEILASLPADLFHQITLRLRIEEHSDAGVSLRDALTYSTTASALSGRDLVLVHVSENWSGPQETRSTEPLPEPGVASIKPLLVIGREVVQGRVFRQVPPPSLGSRIGRTLSRRTFQPGVTGEWLEIDLTAPGGRRETVTREIFDLIGPAQRAQRGAAPAGPEISADRFLDLRGPIYDIFVTTGRLDPRHLPAPEEIQGSDGDPSQDVTAALRGINVGIVLAQDALAGTLRGQDGGTFLFYPDSPRVHILELAGEKEDLLLSLDLRREHVRLAVDRGTAEDAFFARVFRGVVGGSLERAAIETLVARLGTAAQSTISTSRVMERAEAEKVLMLLLPDGNGSLDSGLPADGAARLRSDLDQGFRAVAPGRPLSLSGQPRFAWWRIEPGSGETVGVTDEGLHQTGTEKEGTKPLQFHITKGAAGGWWVHVTQAGYGFGRPFTLAWGDSLGIVALAKVIWMLLRAGAQFRGFGNFPYIPI